jgi:hypothetical protein
MSTMLFRRNLKKLYSFGSKKMLSHGHSNHHAPVDNGTPKTFFEKLNAVYNRTEPHKVRLFYNFYHTIKVDYNVISNLYPF